MHFYTVGCTLLCCCSGLYVTDFSLHYVRECVCVYVSAPHVNLVWLIVRVVLGVFDTMSMSMVADRISTK